MSYRDFKKIYCEQLLGEIVACMHPVLDNDKSDGQFIKMQEDIHRILSREFVERKEQKLPRS
jgi:hypothetical protein